jgi:hypothetical protein
MANAVVRVELFERLAGILSESALAVAVLIENIVFAAFNIRAVDRDAVAYIEIPFHADWTIFDVIATFRNADAVFLVKETVTVFSAISALAFTVGIECLIVRALFNTRALIDDASTNAGIPSLPERTFHDVVTAPLNITSAISRIKCFILSAIALAQATLTIAVVIGDVIFWTRSCWARIYLKIKAEYLILIHQICDHLRSHTQ